MCIQTFGLDTPSSDTTDPSKIACNCPQSLLIISASVRNLPPLKPLKLPREATYNLPSESFGNAECKGRDQLLSPNLDHRRACEPFFQCSTKELAGGRSSEVISACLSHANGNFHVAEVV
ncbi:hypothetical protein ACN47E_010291 [Coniothyrium glycines]